MILAGPLLPSTFDLYAAARQEMILRGFRPDFPPAAQRQLDRLVNLAHPLAEANIRDMRFLLWSSIDNDTSRDLDQAEAAERVPGGIRVLIAIADVDSDVEAGSPIDSYASAQTTSVYAGVRTFPMLPDTLSADLTSLNQDTDRLAVVIDMVVAENGSIASGVIYRALVRNRAQLTYNGVGPWLEGRAPAPPKVAASAELMAQLRLQDEVAQNLHAERERLGALSMDRVETEAIVANGRVQGIEARHKNRATELIENFMVAANGVMARTLSAAGVCSIRRVVKTPERWARIVELAARSSYALPAEPNSGALNLFLRKTKARDSAHYADISLAVVKLMGPGEYALSRPGDPRRAHFALAAHDYTHSTAPNRRFVDTVTQRLIKAVIGKEPPPYSGDELDSIAKRCNERAEAARKVERVMSKRIAAVALQSHIGETFDGVVTGVRAKGVFLRVIDPPAEGILLQGQQGVDVGDRLRVKLLGTDPQRGYLDFGRV